MREYYPEVVQVLPHRNYTVSVWFSDGKQVLYDVAPLVGKGVFAALNNMEHFMETCTVLNDTLAWDIHRNRDESTCLDIDPSTLYTLPSVEETA